MTKSLKLTSAQRQRIEYQQRKDAGLCVDCGDEKETDRVRCDDCATKLRVYQRRWALTAHGRKVDAASVRRLYQTNAEYRERQKQRMRERYHTLKVAGICVRCGQEPATEDCLECKRCQSGEPRRGRPLKAPSLAEIRPPKERRLMMRDRLLPGMRFLDWSVSLEIFEAIGIAESDRNNAQQTLGRLVREGLVERTEFTPHRYCLTASGIVAADKIRNGGTLTAARQQGGAK